MSDTTVFPADEPDDARADFTKQPAAPSPSAYTAPELDKTDTDTGTLLSTEIRVIIGSSERTFGFKAGEDVSYYTGLAGAKVGFMRGRTASIDNVRVSGGHKITDGGVTIVVNRKPRNG